MRLNDWDLFVVVCIFSPLLILKTDWFHIGGTGMDDGTSSWFPLCLQIPHHVDKPAQTAQLFLFEEHKALRSCVFQDKHGAIRLNCLAIMCARAPGATPPACAALARRGIWHSTCFQPIFIMLDFLWLLRSCWAAQIDQEMQSKSHLYIIIKQIQVCALLAVFFFSFLFSPHADNSKKKHISVGGSRKADNGIS